MTTSELQRIPFEEYRAIVKLLHAHVDTYGDKLRGMVAFGELLTNGRAYDIDLLEIVEDWRGGRLGEFENSAELPLRGRLRLYFLTPDEFENPTIIPDPTERRWVEALLQRVGNGYEVIMQTPPGYARRVLERGHGAPASIPPPSGYVAWHDPLKPVPSR